jgi:hypothetical protein
MQGKSHWLAVHPPEIEISTFSWPLKVGTRTARADGSFKNLEMKYTQPLFFLLFDVHRFLELP